MKTAATIAFAIAGILAAILVGFVVGAVGTLLFGPIGGYLFTAAAVISYTAYLVSIELDYTANKKLEAKKDEDDEELYGPKTEVVKSDDA